MWQRRGESADQLGEMRSTCPVCADSPLTEVCQPEKERLREEGREEKSDQEEEREGQRRQRDCKNKGMRRMQRRRKKMM